MGAIGVSHTSFKYACGRHRRCHSKRSNFFIETIPPCYKDYLGLGVIDPYFAPIYSSVGYTITFGVVGRTNFKTRSLFFPRWCISKVAAYCQYVYCSGKGEEEPAMWPRIWGTSRKERERRRCAKTINGMNEQNKNKKKQKKQHRRRQRNRGHLMRFDSRRQLCSTTSV